MSAAAELLTSEDLAERAFHLELLFDPPGPGERYPEQLDDEKRARPCPACTRTCPARARCVRWFDEAKGG